jgi:hypothetical protein
LSVARLIDVLRRLSDLYAAGGAAAQAKDLNSLVDALNPDEGLSVAEFIANIEASSKPKAKKEPKPAKAIDPTVVEKYLRSLKEADDLDEVTTVISIIKHDKIDKDHVFQIAAQFTGGEPRYKSSNDAFARIRGAFIEQKRFENKLKAAHLN